jgi:hypothetical protein
VRSKLRVATEVVPAVTSKICVPLLITMPRKGYIEGPSGLVFRREVSHATAGLPARRLRG